MNRREFLKALSHVVAGYTVAGASAGVGLYQYGVHVEPEWVSLERIQIPVKKLHPALEGFKIVQLSDFHIDSFTKVEVIKDAVTVVNSLQPDIVALTGDYVQDNAEAIFDLTPTLAALNARYGVYSILGNHELWTNAAFIRQELERTGFPVLVNNGLTLPVGQGALYLAGLDDAWSGQPDLKAALDTRPPGIPTILLAHEPDIAPTNAASGQIALQLSGHSHGGQVRLPGLGAIILPPFGRIYDQGLFNVNGMWLYTNRGLGLGPVAYRINCPPEVTEVTLIGA